MELALVTLLFTNDKFTKVLISMTKFAILAFGVTITAQYAVLKL